MGCTGSKQYAVADGTSPAMTPKKDRTSTKSQSRVQSRSDRVDENPETTMVRTGSKQDNAADATSPRVAAKKDSTAATSQRRVDEKPETAMGRTGSKKGVDADDTSPKIAAKKDSTATTSHSRVHSQYDRVDEHARKAPKALRNSADKLVTYLSIPSKDPKMVVRAIFVWITDNIRYDDEGYFGRAPKAPCDAESVMVNGISVCEGYANVTETLCRKANIPVKKISGYAKGYSYAADSPITTDKSTNHAWNAVQLDGKWHLLDSTWGTGHSNTSNGLQKKFKEHYFLTEPAEFVTTHFPYMNKDMAASMEWQLLEKPKTLDEFSKALRYHSSAFRLKVNPISHLDGFVRMNIEEEFLFKWHGEEPVFHETLYHKQGSLQQRQPAGSFGSVMNGIYSVKVHPHTAGTFHLKVYGKKASDPADKSYDGLFTYVIECQNASNDGFEFPETYSTTQTHKVTLLEPLQNKLPAQKTVRFRMKSPLLQRIKIDKTYLTKTGSTFEGEIQTGPPGSSLGVYGSLNDSGRLNGLYKYSIV